MAELEKPVDVKCDICGLQAAPHSRGRMCSGSHVFGLLGTFCVALAAMHRRPADTAVLGITDV
jgi:hypothetical protein